MGGAGRGVEGGGRWEKEGSVSSWFLRSFESRIGMKMTPVEEGAKWRARSGHHQRADRRERRGGREGKTNQHRPYLDHLLQHFGHQNQLHNDRRTLLLRLKWSFHDLMMVPCRVSVF